MVVRAAVLNNALNILLSETLTVDINFIYLSDEQRDQAWHW